MATDEKVCIFCHKGPADGVGVHPIHDRPGEYACLRDGFANFANHTYIVTVPVSVVIPECFGEGDALVAAKETISFPLSDLALGVRVQWANATVIEQEAS